MSVFQSKAFLTNKTGVGFHPDACLSFTYLILGRLAAATD